MKKNKYNDKRLENLANAIIMQAARDYAAAYMGEYVNGQKPEIVIRECEKFFRSKWFERLTNIDGSWLMMKLKVAELQKAKNIFERALAEDAPIRIALPRTTTHDGIVYTIPPKLKGKFHKIMIGIIKQLKEEISEIK